MQIVDVCITIGGMETPLQGRRVLVTGGATGIGAAAIEVGRRLARLARTSQVIAVTHLAQVAAFANNHLSVVKANDGQVTASSVRRLDGKDREAEMARRLVTG